MSRKQQRNTYDDDDLYDDDDGDYEEEDLLDAVYERVESGVPATVTEAAIVAAIRAANYDADKAIRALTRAHAPAAGSTPGRGGTAPAAAGALKSGPPASAVISSPAAKPGAKAPTVPSGSPAAGPTQTGKASTKGVHAGAAGTATDARAVGAAALETAPSRAETLPTLPAPEVPKDAALSAGRTTSSGSQSHAIAHPNPHTPAPLPAVPPEITEAATAAKSRLSVVILGHVDAGKSTLTGHLLYDLGCVSVRTLQQLVKQSRAEGKGSFAYAWILDEDSTERARGVTIDVARNHFETERHVFTLLDAPGHRDFIPNTLTAIAQADVAVLVVDATPGEFEMSIRGGGQAGEHALLARNLGITQLIVAVNKMDGAVVRWSQARFENVKAQLLPFLTGIGFKTKDVTFVPLSGLTGINVVRSPAELLQRSGVGSAASAAAAPDDDAAGRDHHHAYLDAYDFHGGHVKYADSPRAVPERSSRHEESLDDMAADLGLDTLPQPATAATTARSTSNSSSTAPIPADSIDYASMDVLAFSSAALHRAELQTLVTWYKGPTLIEALNSVSPPPRLLEKPLRVCVSDVYKTAAHGLVAAGRIEGGWVADRAKIVAIPGSASGLIKSVALNGHAVPFAWAGDNVDLSLGGFDEAGVAPGKVLCWPSHPMRMVTKFKAQIATFPSLEMPLVPGQQLILHTHLREEPCIVTRILRTLNKAGHTQDIKPRFIGSGVVAVVRIRASRAVPLDLFVDHRRLGRFILRYGGKSVAAGMVTKIKR